jgi:predicted nucleic acid-binding protein
MRHIVLDTTILIAQWRRRRLARPLTELDEAEVERWARQLIEIEQSDATVTPVLLEFLCGVGDKREMILARAFLKSFKAIDDRRTLRRDWQEAQRLAERVPANRRPRDLGDCLIRAIAQRLNHDVRTLDTGMPRS